MRRVLEYGCAYGIMGLSFKIKNNRISFVGSSDMADSKDLNKKTEVKKNIVKAKQAEKIEVLITDKTNEIVEYLNERTGKSFRAKNQKTTKLINARISEGFDVEDFKVVIDKKTDDWLGSDYNKYLRPETLFGNKFESYLNEQNTNNGKSINQARSNSFHTAIERADAINYEILNEK
jgi:uncharacterized phage protein (TIGR02220 family)